MIQIYKTRYFTRWAHKEKLSDAALLNAAHEMDQGLIDANLGGDVYKKRVALGSKGKRGGSRLLVAYKVNDKVFFIYGFSKSEQSNIDKDQLIALKKLAKNLLGYSASELNKAINANEIIEVKSNE